MGCHVTTIYFSQRVQLEIAEDEFPLIHGRRIAEEVLGIMSEVGTSSVLEVPKHIDDKYRDRISDRRPGEILLHHYGNPGYLLLLGRSRLSAATTNRAGGSVGRGR
jgi:hypothetical protein